MIVIIWQFRVLPGSEAAFEIGYGPDGDWTRLFRKSSDFVKTELFRNTASEGTYMTLDYWKSQEAFERFQSEHRTEYLELDRGFESLTLEETRIGVIES